jgi:hypothetical protein
MIMNKRYIQALDDVKRYLADIAYRVDIGELDVERAREVRQNMQAITQLFKIKGYNKKVDAEVKQIETFEENMELIKKLADKKGG